jgi:hypothetical protein
MRGTEQMGEAAGLTLRPLGEGAHLRMSAQLP